MTGSAGTDNRGYHPRALRAATQPPIAEAVPVGRCGEKREPPRTCDAIVDHYILLLRSLACLLFCRFLLYEPFSPCVAIRPAFIHGW